MMRSLWSGVSGLQSHQVAMDVESHNIANVNTVGFKYSRANFSDQFSQTARPATAPEGELGGKNAMQIGLGTQIVSTQQIFSQGSIETTDSNTDMAIQGNGFFIVSPDGGLTRYYTRNGQFTRDSLGNFVDNNGYIVQGWMRDEETNTIDPTGPIKNIVIEPGLSIPANATTEINYKGNLNSGNEIGSQSSPIYSLDHHHGWVDKNGDGLINNNNELFGTTDLGNSTENNENWAEFYTDAKGNVKMHEKGVDLGVIFNEKGSSLNLRENQGIWVSYADAKYTSGEITGLDANAGTNLNIDLNGVNIQGNVKTLGEIEALINAKQAQTGVSASIVNGNRLQLVNQNNTGTTENMKNIKLVANAGNNANAVGGLIFGGANQGQQAPTTGSATIITAYKYTYSKAAPDTATHEYNDATDRKVRTTEDLRRAMQTDARLYVNYNEGANGVTQILSAAGAAAVEAWQKDGTFTQNATANRNDGVEVTINEQGQFSISNPAGDAWNEQDGNGAAAGGGNNAGNDTIDNRDPQNAAVNRNTDADDHTLTLTVTGFSSDTVNVNQKLTDVFSSISGSLTSGSSSTKVSSAIKMASHSMTTEVYDSLGTKHEVAIEFRKVEQTEENGTRWSMVIRVPEPAQINPDAPVYKNIITGEIRFKSDGSILGYQPSSITLTPNNGSSAGQTIALNFGTLGGFEGMRSYDAKSSTDNIAQDGYKGGTLNDLRIDENGKIIGSFTNGRSLALAQVGMATFTNNNGLENLGGNVFGETANSGAAVIGAANSGARGKISGSALEMSNVDLSRAFTQLIVVQRGYQANSKTITTSDTMLNTLLQLKQ
ncbi:flagellar hook protein, epsilonproteobacterial variant [Candidatus Campylobacter infans]|uniref:Flagellar hook protein FlgE n=1 Tax=Candidatus Campylobacter infans TaxID=2561898 RepID=A0A7H9CJ65_9BACT|nr:flagellar hook protein FlgE [Candidatus Campylobacter infans]QLI06167.1 flagellar hook protein, epsilonproteobacterial variant [Candidatus Campylobacter infans]